MTDMKMAHQIARREIAGRKHSVEITLREMQ